MSTTSPAYAIRRDDAAPADSSRADEATRRWPPKYNVCGVMISATDYDETVECLVEAAEERESAVASFFAVHAVVTAGGDEALKRAVNQFEIIGPDGQPVRWALRLLHGVRLAERVYGPELTLRLCRRAAERGLPIYLYGGANEGVLEKLEQSLVGKFPNLRIAGRESPPFRALTAEEDDALVERIDVSGAALVLIGLGCPKQDLFAAAHRNRLSAVQVCVGAAFDFHAGVKSMAPGWMQRRGLEWFYRLCQEPRRLARRYAATNSVFLARLALALAGRRS
jgi:exopolysaccharide biosynthesis WecB/TagA/CpsF family protein